GVCRFRDYFWLRSCFFFSSRRRHTRWPRDWSSDVCSSDLNATWIAYGAIHVAFRAGMNPAGIRAISFIDLISTAETLLVCSLARSEERRVGKECRCRGLRGDVK